MTFESFFVLLLLFNSVLYFVWLHLQSKKLEDSILKIPELNQ